MKYFAVFSVILLVVYLVGFIKKPNTDFAFMNRDFTTAIKGFSIITVVWAHTGARLSVGGIQFIAGVGVALFLICSGYGLEMSYQKNGLKCFWTKRFLKACIPFWIIEFVGLRATQQFEIKKYLLDAVFIRQATGYGWFMQYIVICYILFFVVKKFTEKGKISETAILIAAFTVWFIIDSIFLANPAMPFLKARQMLSFPLGVMIAKNKEKIENTIFHKGATALIISGAVGIIFTGITQLSVVKTLPYIVSNILSLFTVLPLAIAIVAFMGLMRVLLNSWLLLRVGMISYDCFLLGTL